MKKIMLSVMTVVCLAGFSALSFAGDPGNKMKGEMKGEMKAETETMKAKEHQMKGEMKGMKGEMKGAMGK